MKIKEITKLKEDGVTIAAVTGDKAKLSNGQEVDAKTLTPDQKHPGQYTMPEMDPTAIKAGAVVSTGSEATSEDYDEEDEHPDTTKHYNNWMSSEHAPHDSDSGDENAVFHKALHFLAGKAHPGDMEYHAHHMTKKFHGGHGALDEKHHDTIASGNHDVGGDATDNFIDQVRDKGFERSQVNSRGNRSPLGENDELAKWLTIAGIK
jgi:hypothetical protein